MQILDTIREVLGKYRQVDLTQPALLRANLSLVLQMIAASEGLLRAGIEGLSGPANEFDHLLHAYYVEHLAEEANHHAWLSEDLDDEPIVFHWGVAELAGIQYYLVNHVHPGALLGYMLVLEGLPTSLEQIDQLEAIHGIKLLRTMRYHAVHDLDHSKDLIALVEQAPEELKHWIFENAIQTAHRLGMAQEKLGASKCQT